MSPDAVRRAANRIESCLEDARTGANADGSWYAKDRFAAIAEVAQAAANGDEAACMIGTQGEPADWDHFTVVDRLPAEVRAKPEIQEALRLAAQLEEHCRRHRLPPARFGFVTVAL